MSNKNQHAPGAPGIKAKWTSSAKSGIVKSLSASSDVLVTISHGILNEAYFPDEDIACTRDMEFIVTNGKDFFSEEKRHTNHVIKNIRQGLPAYKITNTCKEKRYRITKFIVADPVRNTILQKVKFESLKGEDLRLFAIISPHLNNKGNDNNGWIGDYKGMPMLFANKQGYAMAFACSVGWLKRSVGYVGESDGYKDILTHHKMEWEYQNADNGNIALTGEIDWKVSKEFILAISFGNDYLQAGQSARASLLNGFDTSSKQYIKEWKAWQKKVFANQRSLTKIGENFKISVAVLRLHESKIFAGGIIASLSFPWGRSEGDNDNGGYHLVWARDLVEASGGMIAADSKTDMLWIINYMMSIQEADGHWEQNTWLNGDPYWKGIQLDETALPVLLLDLCKKYDVFESKRILRYWQQIRLAAVYLIRKNFISDEDRWEEQSGISIFSISTMIAAMLCAASMADEYDEKEFAEYCRQVADFWNFKIEESLYVTDTELCKKYNVDGYYIRINPDGRPAEKLKNYCVDLINRPGQTILLENMVSCDALSLVRFGLRKADDPKIINTVKVIDGELKTDTVKGPSWHRYSGDGYGEKENGDPYDSNGGIGRCWPLLTGERGHYEIAKGNIKEAKELIKAMDQFSSNGLLPEQVWDAEDIPEKELYNGRPTGSAMPLVWAHAEYIKLCASVKAKKVFDMPRHTTDRYIKQQNFPQYYIWRFNIYSESVPVGLILRIESEAPFRLRYSKDDWKTSEDMESKPSPVGLNIADLPKEVTSNDGTLVFTFYWPESNNWEEKNYSVQISSSPLLQEKMEQSA